MPGASVDDLAVAARAGRVTVYGFTRPFAAHVAARLVATGGDGPLVVVVPDENAARQFADDLALFTTARPPGSPDANDAPGANDGLVPPAGLRVPALDTSPYAEIRTDRLALLARMAALYRLARGGSLVPGVVVVSALSLVRRVIPAGELAALSTVVSAGEDVDRDALVAALVAAGYSRTPVVDDPGTFAVRGGVLDVFSPVYRYPVRIELFGDTVESLRLFDPEDQRTLRDVTALHVHPVRETVATRDADVRKKILAAADAASHPSAETRRVLERVEVGEDFIGLDTLAPAFHAELVPLWTYFGHDGTRERPSRWLLYDPDAILAAVEDELEGAEARYAERLADGRLAFSPGEHYVSRERLQRFVDEVTPCIAARSLQVHRPPGATETGGTGTELHFAVDDNRTLRAELERARRLHADELLRPLVAAFAGWREEGWRVAVAAGSQERVNRLVALLGDYGVTCAGAEVSAGAAGSHRLDPDALEPGGPPVVVAGSLSEGFGLRADKLALLSADDIFGPRRRSSARHRQAAKRARAALTGGAGDFSQLAPGDHVVHDVHGVGRYCGLAKLPVTQGGLEIDFLHVEYRGGRLYLPVYRLGEVVRYIGAEGHAPRLDKLGGVSWQKSRRKASEQIKALAEELLQIYAQRAALPGYAFPPGDAMYREFEAMFPFDETPDQQAAIDDVLADMEASRPMDRLVCGDVGYGKTEVALRAMFKAAYGNKQTALLAPTTVLVEQHHRTMSERFAGWPLEIAKLSRFQPRAEQIATIKGLAEGTIDAVVGTHRLLSRDVRFKDLGLLVIDEEQRFGVAQKERFKRIRTQLDVLTLTATPIPRTLHLAMSGMRDLSIIATPPADRRSVRTMVARYDDAVLREGIRRELGRGGQVFFVCPRIVAATPHAPGQGAAPKRRATRRAASGGRTLEDWAEHLRELVPEARVVVGHGQMKSSALEKVMVGFVSGKTDVLVSTTIIENGLDIPRANTMFIAGADRFGLAQLYQLRGRIGRSRERASCYLLVPPAAKLSSDARRRLEALQRFSDLGAGFQIASHDLEIRGGGELLGSKQSGAISAVGFETYVSMLEEAVAELRGTGSPAIRRARDPELNVELPGYIPDDYIPDPGQRLELYKRLSDADDEDEVRAVTDEIADRYGGLPEPVITLGELMVLKTYARVLRAQSVELTPSRLVLALAEDTPLASETVLDLVADERYKLTPDMRLVRSFTAEESGASLDGASRPGGAMEIARRCLQHLVALATQRGG